MASVITRGLSLIEFGDLASDGGPATTFAQLGKTLRDSCEVVQDDPEIQEYLAEEVDAPLDRSVTLGKVNINLTVMDPDLAAMVALMGGTLTGSGATQVYNAPSAAPIIEKTIRITPVKGYKIIINRASLVGTLNFKANRKDVLSIMLKGVALVPAKAGVAIWNTAV